MKNNQHRFHVKNKTVKSYANTNSDKCLVRIVDFYRSKIPANPKAFYLRPLEKIPSDPDKPWFVNTPVGINTLNNLVRSMCEKVDNLPKYTNHLLRATAANRLFQKGVPEKIIAERTGHRSLAGLRAYERTTSDQDRAASSVIALKESTFDVSTTNSCVEVLHKELIESVEVE